MIDDVDGEASPLAATIIGGGVAGAGLLLAARAAGLLGPLLERGIRILERTTTPGGGHLGNYVIRSDSFADSFVRAVEAPGTPDLSAALTSSCGSAVVSQRGAPVSLATAAGFLRATCTELRQGLAGRDCFITGAEALFASRTPSGLWQTHYRTASSGRPAVLWSHHLVLATGAEESTAMLGQAVIAGEPLLPRFAGKVILSSRLLSTAGRAEIAGRLAARAFPRVAIIGGSHSAISSARLLLDTMPELRFGPGAVTLLHRRPLRLTYQDAASAHDDGYTDFGPDDICARTGRVFPLAGFRGDARELMRRVLQLGGQGPERRLVLHRLDQQTPQATREVLEAADLIVTALGYRPRALPLFDAEGRAIPLGAATGRPLVDGESRVLGADGTAVPNVHALGLAAGYPLAGTHGEASFQGQANGLALWHGSIGVGIVRAVLA